MAKKRSKKGRKNPTHVSDTVESYTGPLIIPKSVQQRDVVEVNLEYSNSAVTSSSGGVIALVYGLNVSLFHNYTNQTNAYDEFRLLKATLWYIPEFQNFFPVISSSATALGGPLILWLDRDSNSTPASYDNFEFASCKLKCVNQPMKINYEMAAQPDAAWSNVTTTSPAWFKFYGSGFSNSITYGNVFVKALYQFRGRA